MVKHCRFYFGAEAAEGGGNFTLQAGVTPSRAVMRFPLRARIPQVGPMRLTDGTLTATLPECRATRRQVTQGTQGRWQEVTIVDRRWRWSDGFFAVYGEYNVKSNQASPVNFRTPRELASILLDAMGETRYDVSALPQMQQVSRTEVSRVTGPAVQWDAANPAAELEILCQQYGCVVTLTLDNRVVIHRDGYGAEPRRDSRQMDFTSNLEPPIIPRALVAEAGQTMCLHDIWLQPVALHRGEWISIYDLPYKPTAGWQNEDPWTFGNVLSDWGQAAQDQAKKYVWRFYRIFNTQLPVPSARVSNRVSGGYLTTSERRARESYFHIEDIWRILPTDSNVEINGYWYTGATLNANNYPPALPYDAIPTAYGGSGSPGGATTVPLSAFQDANWITPVHPGQVINPPLSTPQAEQDERTYTDPFDYNEQLGLVEFPTPIYFEDIVNGRLPAVLRLRVRVPIRDPLTSVPISQQFWQTPQSPNAVNIPKIIKRSDYWYEYSRYQNNENEFILNSLAYLSQELNTYRIQSGVSAPYKGFVFDIAIDGIARAIVFDVAENGGGTTHIDFNMERPESYFTLQEARNRRLITYDFWLKNEYRRKQQRGIVP